MIERKIKSIEIVFACGHTYIQQYAKGATKREADAAIRFSAEQLCPKCESAEKEE